MIDGLKDIALVALAVSTLALGAAAVTYRGMYHEAHGKLVRIDAAIEQQNRDAQRRLQELIAERDRRQSRLDELAREQERKDADAKAEIARLAAELERRPVRVRIVAAPGGHCGGSADGDGAAAANAGDRNTAPTDGVLPAENTRRLAEALTEVETLSAAYNACRARLMASPD